MTSLLSSFKQNKVLQKIYTDSLGKERERTYAVQYRFYQPHTHTQLTTHAHLTSRYPYPFWIFHKLRDDLVVHSRYSHSMTHLNNYTKKEKLSEWISSDDFSFFLKILYYNMISCPYWELESYVHEWQFHEGMQCSATLVSVRSDQVNDYRHSLSVSPSISL